MADQKAEFLFRFLDDCFDLFPQADRERFATYWSGLIQVAAAWLQTTLETDLGGDAFNMPTFETERWDEYIFSPDTAMMDVFTETPTLTGLTPVTLSNLAVFYSTLQITSAVGSIPFAEVIGFTGDEEVQLTYSSIVQSTVAVTAGSGPVIVFVEGHDYVVNYALGQVQRTPNTNIAPLQALNVSYQHATYRLGLDYAVDQNANTLAKVAGSNIPDGVVTVSYVRDQTPGPLLTGTNGTVITTTELADQSQNFTGFLPGRTLIVVSPPDVAGTYTISSVISQSTVQVSPPFSVGSETGVVYNIDAYPYGMAVNQKIVSIPTLQNTITNPTQVYFEGVDYAVVNGQLGFRHMPPFNTLGPQARQLPIFWAEKTLVDNQTPYRNYGVLIDFFRTNSDAYVSALRGLLYALWTGSTNENLIRGIQILLGLPFAPRAGTIISLVETTRPVAVQAGDSVVAATATWTFALGDFSDDDVGRVLTVTGSADDDGSYQITQVNGPASVATANDFPVDGTFTGSEQVTVAGAPATLVLRNDRGQDVPITIPLGVAPTVAVGDSVTAFQPLSTGVQIYDKVNDPGFLTTRVGIQGIARYFVPGITAAEQAMALVFLEQHLFLPTINVNAVQGVVNVDEIENFLDILKPSWTNYIFGFESIFEESLSFGETLNSSDISVILDLTTRVTQNEVNLADPSQIFLSTTGSIINVGGVNVLHDAVSFTAFTWDDTVEIESGPNTGAYRIVSISGNNMTLWPTPPSLDAPVTYRVVYKEMALSHDAPEFTDQSYTIGTGTVAEGVLTDVVQQFLHGGVVVGMTVLITSGGAPVTGPTIPGLFTVTAVTQTTLTLSPAPADGSYSYEFSQAYIRATGGGVGLPLTQAI